MPNVRVITAATARWVLTEAEARALLGSALPPETPTATVETWLAQLTSTMEGALNRTLPQERVEETFIKPGYRQFVLSRAPVKTIHAVTIDGTALTSDDWQVEDEQGGVIRLLVGLAASIGLGMGDYTGDYAEPSTRGIGLYSGAAAGRKQVYKIEYTGGFGMPGSADTPALPEAIKAVAFDALRAVSTAATRDPTITAMRLGDASWSFSAGTADSGASGPAGELITRARTGTLSPWVRNWL